MNDCKESYTTPPDMLRRKPHVGRHCQTIFFQFIKINLLKIYRHMFSITLTLRNLPYRDIAGHVIASYGYYNISCNQNLKYFLFLCFLDKNNINETLSIAIIINMKYPNCLPIPSSLFHWEWQENNRIFRKYVVTHNYPNDKPANELKKQLKKVNLHYWSKRKWQN